jgi:hypothetical protein
MNNSNDLTKTILQTIGTSNSGNNLGSGSGSGLGLESDYTSSNGSGVLDYLKSIPWYTWVILFFILSFLGFNIFVYLGKGTQGITDLFGPIITKILSIFGMTGVQLVDNTAEGAKKVVNTTADALDTGLTSVQDVMPKTSQGTPIKNTIPQPDIMKNNSLNQVLNKENIKQSSSQEYEADDTNSSIQTGPNKSGYCYIGEDKGYRSCVYVKESDTCMSGDIFPTNDICVNPTLRT